jgi:hypothetical protein
MPASVHNAVRLMYAGAACVVVYAIGFVIAVNAYTRDHPLANGNLAGGAVLLSLIEIALWLGIARACKRGKNWARITGTVMFGIYTLGVLGVLADPHPGFVLTKVLTAVSWLIGCGAVVFLWQRPSSAFFRGSRRALGP